MRRYRIKLFGHVTAWGDLRAGNLQQVRQMFSRYDTVSFIQFRSPPEIPVFLFLQWFCTCGIVGLLTDCLANWRTSKA